MHLSKEVSRIAGLFKTREYRRNEFTNPALSFADFPALKRYMDGALQQDLVEEPRDRGWTVAVQPGTFEIQWHQTSVEEHTDDIRVGSFFQLLVLRAKPEVVTAYDSQAQLRYFDVGGKNQVARLSFGDSIIFAPWRKHSLTYFGESVLIALRSVRKRGPTAKRVAKPEA